MWAQPYSAGCCAAGTQLYVAAPSRSSVDRTTARRARLECRHQGWVKPRLSDSLGEAFAFAWLIGGRKTFYEATHSFVRDSGIAPLRDQHLDLSTVRVGPVG